MTCFYLALGEAGPLFAYLFERVVKCDDLAPPSPSYYMADPMKGIMGPLDHFTPVQMDCIVETLETAVSSPSIVNPVLVELLLKV